MPRIIKPDRQYPAPVGASLLAMNDNAVGQTFRVAAIASKLAPTGAESLRMGRPARPGKR
ncbi:hypothetical protein F2A38_07030 [Pseudomonas chlororaphis]|uniref:Uncharacterized protein n=1 Tax=Pseudomonas chlororaphis TaxID=587753 RepID=A0AB34CAI1_9PSED|nr:hypothetical protein F2A38_07030 [Pseudomonas chlororaphis]